MLSKYIITTLVYYDAMDYPLTVFEVWKYLTKINREKSARQYSLAEILEELEKDALKKYIEEYRGYYFLRGREELYKERIKRNKIARRKYKLLFRIVRFLQLVPYTRMIAVTGRLSMKHAEPKSDLDLFVVFQSGKIFTGRFLFTILAHFLGIRRHGDKIADRICLNYFIATSSLEITLKDLFASSEYSFIFPVFGHEIFHKFKKQNSWIRLYKPNYEMCGTSNDKSTADGYVARAIRMMGEKILRCRRIENLLKKLQLKKIDQNPKTHWKGSMVIANDEMLVFLPKPRGPKIYNRFSERLRQLEIRNL